LFEGKRCVASFQKAFDGKNHYRPKVQISGTHVGACFKVLFGLGGWQRRRLRLPGESAQLSFFLSFFPRRAVMTQQRWKKCFWLRNGSSGTGFTNFYYNLFSKKILNRF
jgi:hypothetical protein